MKGKTHGEVMQMGLLIDWTTKALCQEGDPDALFVQGAEQNNAKKICRGCPVRLECLADALDNRIEFGVWGGMTERERRALLRKHADVRSWRSVFEVALEEEQRSARKTSRQRIPVNVNFLAARRRAAACRHRTRPRRRPPSGRVLVSEPPAGRTPSPPALTALYALPSVPAAAAPKPRSPARSTTSAPSVGSRAWGMSGQAAP